MAFEQGVGGIPGLKAAATLETSQYLAVKADSSGNVVLQATEGAPILGILQDDPKVANAPCCVVNSGVSKAVCGAAVTAGNLLMVTTTSKLIPATAGKNVVGLALASGSTNEIIPVSLDTKGYVSV